MIYNNWTLISRRSLSRDFSTDAPRQRNGHLKRTRCIARFAHAKRRADQRARGVVPKEGRTWTTKAEESDFGDAIVGNAKHTRSYLIYMHIVTALALEPGSGGVHVHREGGDGRRWDEG